MQRHMLKSKIYRAKLTGVTLEYQGSIKVDQDLMDAADLLPGEQVDVLNVNNGARLTTYVIRGKRKSGIVELNGPAARLGVAGDPVVVLAYAVCDEQEARRLKPKIVFVDGRNRPR